MRLFFTIITVCGIGMTIDSFRRRRYFDAAFYAAASALAMMGAAP